ncbi:hypothetical protein HK102_003382 [Quaeritorhiza haematococci]|nr:hypothetical protein HK102_003382 [Quaeritorhiza haematococci]
MVGSPDGVLVSEVSANMVLPPGFDSAIVNLTQTVGREVSFNDFDELRLFATAQQLVIARAKLPLKENGGGASGNGGSTNGGSGGNSAAAGNGGKSAAVNGNVANVVMVAAAMVLGSVATLMV